MNRNLAFFVALSVAAGMVFGAMTFVSAQARTAEETGDAANPIQFAPPAPKAKQQGRQYVEPTGAIDFAEYPKRGIIIGNVIELSTYAMMPNEDGTEKYIEASRARAEQGFPVGIVEEGSGEVYLAFHKPTAPASSMTPANGKLAPLMGKRIVAAGLRYKKDGVSVFRITVMSEF